MFKVFLIFFLSFTINLFSQKPCDDGMFSFQQKDGINTLVLMKNREMLPSRFLTNDLIFTRMLSMINAFESRNGNKIKFDKKVEVDLIESQEKKIVCYDSLVEQVMPFLKEEVSELTVISQKGIPFLTFTKIEE